MSGDDQILRRHFIAIATDAYQADGTFGKLDVGREVDAMRRWLTDKALGGRRFDGQAYAALADRPSYDQIKTMLRNESDFTDADAVVLYVTGHGMTGPDNSHLIVLHDTNPQKPGGALRTADLVLWLAEHRDLKQVMLIIDVCQAGQLDNNLPAQLKSDLPPGWLVVLTAQADANAKLGAFTDAVEATIDELRCSSDAASRAEPYLKWQEQFLGPVFQRLEEGNRPRPDVLRFPWPPPPSVYLPNPGFDPGEFEPVPINPARRDLAILSQEMTAHWALRAPVLTESGPVFTGRARLMQALIDFTQGEAGTLLVTGRAGCGKSSSLARLVTCSDPDFRREHASALAVAEPVPPDDAVDVAILATGKTTEQIAQQLGRALGIEGPQPGARTSLEGWIAAIIAATESRERTLTLVVDALDEASDPGAVLTTLLARLNSAERQRLRLLVGVRSSGDADTTNPDTVGEGASDLVSVAAMTLGRC